MNGRAILKAVVCRMPYIVLCSNDLDRNEHFEVMDYGFVEGACLSQSDRATVLLYCCIVGILMNTVVTKRVENKNQTFQFSKSGFYRTRHNNC